jgi:hypothetical protein
VYIPVPTTSRADFRATVGVNTHFNKAGYQDQHGDSYDKRILDALVELRPGFIREAWWPGNPPQQEAFAVLVSHRIRLHLTLNNAIGLGDIDRYVQACVDAGFDRHVTHFAGLNEPNDNHPRGWAAKTLNYQQALFDAVTSRQAKGHFPRCKVAGPSLKHQVTDLDADYRAISEVRRFCQVGNFHFYPAWNGAYECPGELERARQAFGEGMDLLQTESGRSRDDSASHQVAKFLVDWHIRMFFEPGCAGSVGYEFADEDNLTGREAQFGLFNRSTGPWAAYHALRPLLAAKHGGEPSPVSVSKDTDAKVLVFSNGSGQFDVFLSWPPGHGSHQRHAELLLPHDYTCDTGRHMTGSEGDGLRYRIDRPRAGALLTAASVSPRPA